MIQLLAPILFARAKTGTTILAKNFMEKVGMVILTEVVKKGILKDGTNGSIKINK